MRKSLLLLMFGIMMISTLQADLLPRIDEIFIEDSQTINTGGIGNFIAGVDVDGDGLLEIYMVNHNWNDVAGELVPRIYKYERATDGTWNMVWMSVPPTDLVEKQNSYPPLSLVDLDADGKMELIWGIPNNLGTNLNPARILVYEHASGDNFGVENAGSWEPNASWSITDEESANIRVVDWEFNDIDADGDLEIIFAGRTSGMRFGICSVSDIPDNGDGSETWTLEFSSADVTYTGDNKWDVGIIGSNIYMFDEVEISKLTWTGTDYTYTALSPLPGGISWSAVQVYDVDGDGTEEMLTGEYRYGDATRHIWLLEEEADTLLRTPLFDIAGADYLNGGRLIGGTHGDIDADGDMDFVYGSMYSGPPNGIIFRVEYQGGDIQLPASWELSIIDSAYAVVDLADGGMWNRFAITNMDEDEGLEVLYTSMINVPYSMEFPTTGVSAPVIVLDSPNTSVSIEERDVQIADSYKLKQNYPNPFNPSTTITFHIPQNELVSLNVYDLQGRKVASLLYQSMSAGSYDLTWGGLDDNGAQVASGVYVYTLKTSSYTDSKTMLFLK